MTDIADIGAAVARQLRREGYTPTRNKEGVMTRLYAVKFAPNDGPASVFLVEASQSSDAKHQVLGYLHGLDMDAVTLFDLTVQDLGIIEDITVLGKTLKERATFIDLANR